MFIFNQDSDAAHYVESANSWKCGLSLRSIFCKKFTQPLHYQILAIQHYKTTRGVTKSLGKFTTPTLVCIIVSILATILAFLNDVLIWNPN